MKKLVLAAVALLALPGVAEAKSWPPRDTCGSVPGATDFRRALTTTVVNRDEAMLLALASPEILLDFGGGSGRETLRERLDDPHYNLWRELDALLLLGCAAGDGGEGPEITLPWYWSQRFDEVDGMEGMLATGPDVAMRAAPDGDAKLLARLNWDAVQLAGEWEENAEYLRVSKPKGPTGYVRSDQLRSLIDYRLLAQQRDGKWQITVLVAGD